MATNKKIILHPIKADGTQDKSINLNPQTSTECIEGEIKGLHYDTIEQERVIGVSLADTPNWESIQELMPSMDYQQIYLNGEESIWLQCMPDNYGDLVWQLSITLDDWDTNYCIFNRNFELDNRSETTQVTGNVWYYNGEISEKPEIELDVDNIYNNNDDLFYCIVDKETEKILINRTLQDKNEDIANWQYYKETKYYTPQEYETYPLNNELSQEYMSSLISSILSNANTVSKYSNYMFGVNGYIMDTTQSDLSLWTFYNSTTHKWEPLNSNFVGFGDNVPTSWYIHNSQIFYYNNRTFMAMGNGGMSISKCLVELSFDIATSTLTLTLHSISLGANENTIYARGVFEWDNKLLCKEYGNNDVYELDLDNFTATLSQYHIFYTTYYNGERTIFGNPSNIYMPNYNWVTSIESQSLATSYDNSEVSRIRHAQEGDQEVVYQGGSQQYTLDEYSLILERVDASDSYGGTNSGYNAMSNRFYVKDGEGNRRIATFTYNSGKLFWIFNESTSLFESINVSLSSEAVDVFYREYIFYVGDDLYYYDGTHKKLYKQITIENNSIVFNELPIDWSIDSINVYENEHAKSDEVATITCNYNSQLEGYELRLNNTYYYRGGENWVDAQGEVADVSGLKITYSYDYAYLAESLIYDLAQLRYYVITTMEQKLNEPLKDKKFGKIATSTEVANDLEEDTEYSFKTNMEFSEDDIDLLMNLSNEDYIYNDEDNYRSIQFINDDGDVYLVCYDDGSWYNYTIYSNSGKITGWVNEWLGSEVPESFYLHLECINPSNEVYTTMMKRILNVGTHKETTLKEITLDEKIKDLPNWQYETKTGILTIPNWELTYDYMGSYATVYAINNEIEIEFGSSPVRGYSIYDITNNTGYMIYEEDMTYSNITYKANIWYSWNLQTDSIPEQCDTPNITLDRTLANPNILELFDALYGENAITLKEKLDNLNPKLGPLKDMVYDYTQGELEDGQEYTLSDNYDSFFEKYGNGQSTLIYSAVNEDVPVIDDGGMLALNVNNTSINSVNDSISNDEPVQTRGGEAMLDPGVEAPINTMPTIISIYLYTDSTPSPTPTPIKTREGVKGGDYMSIEDPGTSLLGSASLEVYTTQGTITFNQGGNSWYYNDTAISLNQVPSLILNTSYIKDEQMLKDFLQLEDKSQTLGEKLDEIENTPLKDKLYEGTNKLILATIPNWEEVYNIVYNNRGYGEEDTWDYHIYDTRYSDTGIWVCRYETYNNSEVYFQEVNIWNNEEENPKYSNYLIFNKSFYNQELSMNVVANTWYAYNMQDEVYEITGAPNQIILNRSKISTSEDFFVDLFNAIIAKSVTLEEKVADIKNWTYETVEAKLNTGQTYNFLNKYDEEFFTKYEDLFSSGWGTLIYGAEGIAPTAPYFYLDLCYIEAFDNTYKTIVFEGNDSGTDIISGYVYIDENPEYSGWYELTWGNDGYELVIDSGPVPVETPSTLGFNTSLIIDESVFRDLLGLTDTIITLGDKVDGLLKNKTYDIIPVPNTFKPYLRMTPSTLLPAKGDATSQDITLYEDSNNDISFVYNYIHSTGWNTWYHNIIYTNGDNTYTFRINDSLPFKYIYIWLDGNTQITSQDILPSFVYDETLVNVTYKDYFEGLIYQVTAPQSLEQKLTTILPPVDTTTDGTYVLKAVVSDGQVTYTWVLEE